jgi:hypothetical protein
MRPRKAARPATAETVNGPRASSNLPGGSRSSYSNSSLSVYAGRDFLGFIARRRDGFEALDTGGDSLGIFPNTKADADAISAAGMAS